MEESSRDALEAKDASGATPNSIVYSLESAFFSGSPRLRRAWGGRGSLTSHSARRHPQAPN